MRFKLQVILVLLAVAFIGMILQGCASGVRLLGEVEIAEGLTRKYIQIGSQGHDSARITIIESFDVTAEGIKTGSQYQATTDGLIGKIMEGTGAAIAQGGGYAAGAYLLRPNKTTTNVSQLGGGASATGTGTGTGLGGIGGDGGDGGSGGSSVQAQVQGQHQSSRNDNANTNTNTTTSQGGSEGCRGNCGGGNNGRNGD